MAKDLIAAGKVSGTVGIEPGTFSWNLFPQELSLEPLSIYPKLEYRRAYHESLKQQLVKRLGSPASQSPEGKIIEGPASWEVSDGLLLLPPRRAAIGRGRGPGLVVRRGDSAAPRS